MSEGETLNDGSPVSGGGSGYTPAMRVYCAEADVEYVWSTFGVQARTDDDETGSINEGILNQGIEKAAAEMNQILLQLYAAASVAQSPWAKWCNAVLAAIDIGERRGNDIPKTLIAQGKKYRAQLIEIGGGLMPLMLPNGPAPTAQDHMPVVTTFYADTRFPRTKLRRIPSTSSDQTPVGDLKQYNTLDYYPFP